MSPQQPETDVIVVGAGPVGLTAALVLARRGVLVTLLDAGTGAISPEWRGSTLHPPTMEILATLGLAETVVAGSVRVDRVQYRDLELPEVAEFGYADLTGRTAYPFRLQYEQYKLLRLLRSAIAAEERVRLLLEHRVTGIDQGDGRARVTVDRPGGPARLSARWVVGADGSHSTVRKALGIDFPGITYPDPSLVVATSADLAAHIPDLAPVSYWSGPHGRMSLIRTPDVWRIALTVPAAEGSDQDRYGTVDQPHPLLAEMTDVLPGAPVKDLYPLLQHQVYRSHQRVAQRFQQDRFFLAGDAAHITATTGGMGLNSGIHDVWTLAEVLAPRLDAAPDDPEIVRYERERRAVALRVVQPATTENRSTADLRATAERARRLSRLSAAAADPAARSAFLDRAAMFDAVTDRAVEPSTVAEQGGTR